jgi:hypothetical protein
MRLVFIRESDLETFDLGAYPYGPFALDPNVVLPGGTALDITGYEYSGRDGGYQTSSRLQRRPFTAPFMIREDWTTEFGLFELIRQAQGFFDSHNDDLVSELFTIEVYTDDRVQSSYQMRHGTISVPFNAKTDKGEMRASAQVSFIFGDPYLYPIGDSGLTVRLYAGGQTSGTPNGRSWSTTNGAAWNTTNGKTWVTAGGSGDPIAVDVISIATVPVSIISSGQLVDPSIVNLTNDSSFTYDGTLGAGDVLTVDTFGNVLVNGVAPANAYSGSLTAINGTNTFALLASVGSPGYVDLNILGAF